MPSKGLKSMLISLLLAALSVSLPLPARDHPSDRLSVDDILALKSIAAPSISPNGEWIAFEVERNDLEADEESTQLFMVSSDGTELLQLTADDYSASKPRWSPDGRYLGFIAAKGDDEDAKAQVWTLDMRGGDSQAHSAVDQGVSDFRWAPDSKGMVLLIKDKTADDLAKEAAEEAGEDAKPPPYVIDRLQFKRDGVPYLDRSRTHLYFLGERGAEVRQLTFGDFDDSEPAISPDGRSVAFTSNRTEEPDRNDNTDIWLVSIDDSANVEAPRRLTRNPGTDRSPAWSHDGRHITYVSTVEPGLIWYATNHLGIVPSSGGEERLLTRALDRNVSSPRFAADDSSILFLLEDSAEEQLAAYNLDNQRVERLVSGPVAVSGFTVDDRGTVAMVLSTVEHPGEIFLLRDGKTHRLTHLNEAILGERHLAEVSNVTFKSEGGTEIEGFIFTPPDYRRGQRYPTILRIHGGPTSQYNHEFFADAQLFAAHGYVVVTSNPRGSSGYGQDFAAAIFADWGNKDYTDVMAAVDYAIAEGYADPQRLGVGGWSYGGILTNYVITKTDRFAAAITGASELNYIANYGHDHYQLEWELELGLPWEHRDTWERISPWNNVDKITTPTLVIGGKEDWNVPIINSEQLYQVLRRRGVDTLLVVYPDEPHSISRPSFKKDRYERYLDWYGKYLLQNARRAISR
ncbi:MAG: S9 family peptidase [Woeseiaceae bacterium]|nr:S9 family peptidase [Woeseiaceae bacterium]